MGDQDAQRGAQKTACCMCFDISDALSQGRRWHVEPYCDRRWDMGVPYHTGIKTAILALEAYWLAEIKKVQAHSFNKEDHVHRILGQTRRSPGGIFIQDTTINSAVYCEMLKKLRHAIQNKRRGMLSATILLFHDNTRPHSAAQTQDLITSFRWEQMDHPLYSHDLAPSDFHLFLHLKKFLGGKRFDDDDDLKDEVQKWLKSQAAEFYEKDIQKLVPRYEKCLNNGGEYVENSLKNVESDNNKILYETIFVFFGGGRGR